MPRAALAMHAEHRAEAAPRKPAQKQLLEGRIADVAAEEAADVARPPRDTRHRHRQACLQLLLHRPEGGMNIARPCQHGVLLAARPCTAHKGHDILRTLGNQAIVEALGIAHRVGIGALQRRAGPVAVVVEIIGTVLWLRFIQPEAPDTLGIVILAALFPDELLCTGVGRIVEGGIAHPRHVNAIAAVCTNKVALVCHFAKVAAALVNRRPHGHDRLNAHFPQLLHHPFRIRPVQRFKPEVALQRPVKEVNDDHIQRQPEALMLAGNSHQFVLRAIAELALPIAQTIFGHHGRATRSRGIIPLDFRRGVAAGDEVIQLFGRAGRPFGAVGAKCRRADGRIIPQEAVVPAGYIEGHAGL